MLQTRTSPRPAPIVRRMADALANFTAAGAGLTMEEFAARSEFTRAEIEAHGPAAIDLAKQASRGSAQ